VTAIAAIGLTPAYGAHLSMLPVYALIISGRMSLLSAVVSYLLTWVALLAMIYFVGWVISFRRNYQRKGQD
jgi:hypothetical protein